jgi:hypothetical protein
VTSKSATVPSIVLWLARAVALLTPSTIDAAVADVAFAQLVDGSSIIAVGTVVDVFEVQGLKVGRIQLDRVLKGTATGNVLFLNQSTWMCDITGADIGERALWFLVPYEDIPEADPPRREPNVVVVGDFHQPRGFRKAVNRLTPDQPFMSVFWAGRGQMGLREVDGTTYADVWTATVKLPPEVRSLAGHSRFKSVRSARLDDLVSAITRSRQSSKP